MTELTKRKKTPRDLLRIVFRRRYMVLLGASLFAIAIMVWGHYMQLQYTGTTRFQRRMDPASPGQDDNVEGFKDQRSTLRWELGGYHAVAEAAEELDLVKGPYGPDGKLTQTGQMAKQELVNRLVGLARVTWHVQEKDIDQISVSFTHEDPEIAQKMPDMLVRNYINRVSQIIIDRLTSSRGFLEKQVKRVTDDLLKLSEQKSQYESDHVGALYNSPGAVTEQILKLSALADSLQSREKELSRLVLGLEEYVGHWEKLNATTRPVREVIEPNERRIELIRQREMLKERLDDFLVNMKEKHPTIVYLRKQIARLGEKIAKEPEKIVTQEIIERKDFPPDRRADLRKAKQALAVTRKNISRLRDREKKLNDDLNTFSIMRREYLDLATRVRDKSSDLYAWTKRLRSVGGALQAEVLERRTHLDTLQAAHTPIRPSSPSWMRIMAMAILGGLGFGGALVLIANLLDRSISTPEDATKHFNIPVHGVIGEIVTAADRSRRRLIRWILAPTISVVTAIVLLLCGLSIYWYLQHPQKYKQWQNDRVGFVVRSVTGGVDLFD